MGKRLINVDEVEEIVPVLVGKLLENNLITEEQADQIICAIDKMIEWYYQVEEPEFLKFYNCHLEMIK